MPKKPCATDPGIASGKKLSKSRIGRKPKAFKTVLLEHTNAKRNSLYSELILCSAQRIPRGYTCAQGNEVLTHAVYDRLEAASRFTMGSLARDSALSIEMEKFSTGNLLLAQMRHLTLAENRRHRPPGWSLARIPTSRAGRDAAKIWAILRGLETKRRKSGTISYRCPAPNSAPTECRAGWEDDLTAFGQRI